MNAILDLEQDQFFAPSSMDLVDSLIARYQADRKRIEEVVAFTQGETFSKVCQYFIEAAKRNNSRYVPVDFAVEDGIAALNASYWQEALSLTDVLDYMPNKRREEWFDVIHKMETPEFEEGAVRATLQELLASRMDFLAEKVDGLFRALSRTHVTNQPEGFSKRMILTGVTNDWGCYGRTQTGYINDLRQVIAKFMGRDEPHWNATNKMVEIARSEFRGEWIPVDGGAMRVRCYRNGNAHIEIHPEIAWRLNQILAHLYPAAIPSQFRSAPKKRKAKIYNLMEKPLPFAVLSAIGRLEPMRRPLMEKLGTTSNALKMPFDTIDKHLVAEVDKTMQALGGVRFSDSSFTWYDFDYDPSGVIAEIMCTGVIPDQKSHQFYPTPERMAKDAVELADIHPGEKVLEPSAGIGGIADHITEGDLTCVEVSTLHCKILKAKGYEVINADFLSWEEGRFDKIVMNPPYSQGRWQAHIEHAATLLKSNGTLVAIIPASSKGKTLAEGMTHTYSKPYINEFKGASVNTVILKLEAA